MAISTDTLGEIIDTADMLIFTSADEFDGAFDETMRDLTRAYRRGSVIQQNLIGDAMVELGADIHGYGTKWRLGEGFDGSAYVERVRAKLSNLSFGQLPKLNKEIQRTESSNLLKMTQESDAGRLSVRWGNDYAAGLRGAMRRGAVLVTTNPLLVLKAAQDDPEFWNEKLAQVIEDHPDYGGLDRALEMTVKVVAENCKRMIHVNNATKGVERYAKDGAMGFVSLQLDTRNADDAQATFSDAEQIYKRMQDELGEDKPPMVFKVSGTEAGYEAAGRITTEIPCGVNVTVNYTLAQQWEFVQLLERGSATFNYLTEMNRRFYDVVQEQLRAQGFTEEVYTWAGPEAARIVVRELYKEWYQKREHKKTTPLIASMKDEGDILNFLVGGGKQPIHFTVFPNIQELFDGLDEVVFRESLLEETPPEKLRVLNHSELGRRGTTPYGYERNEFSSEIPSAVNTIYQFNGAMEEMIASCERGYFEKAA